jgi:sugar (pentulose or hexulose) kinase
MWLGLDIGTQSVRAAAIAETGSVLAHGAQPLTGRRQGPCHEQEAEAWWRAAVLACGEIMGRLAGREIRGLAVAGTSGTILLTDRSGRALTPGMMYDDVRAREEAEIINQTASFPCRMQPSWALPKLLWLLRHQPEVASRGRLVHQADFINERLAGHPLATDSSNALKTGYDLVRERWPEESFASLGIPDTILPEVVHPGMQLGVVDRAAAMATGIPVGTPIYAGMTDGCAAQIASGALQIGNWNSVLGTTLVLKGVAASLLSDPAGIIYSHRLPGGDWLPGAASSTGAGILSQRFPGRDLHQLDTQAARREPASIVAYPLAGRGERFPFCAPEAEGFVLGNPFDEADLCAALLQGTAFIERLCYAYLRLLGMPFDGSLTLTGGAARSRYWCQLRADILGWPVRLPENTEPALGVAILAASAGQRIAQVAAKMVSIREVIEPRPDRAGRFQEPYGKLLAELARRGWLSPALLQKANT